MNEIKYEDFYSKNTKYYHTIHHVNNLLKLWMKYRNDFLIEYPDLNEDALIEAIKWHDSYYVPGENDNENLSIKLYIDNVKMVNPLVCLIIESTKVGYNDHDLTDELKVMHDLDWSGFNDYEVFKVNCEKIYTEAIEVGKFDPFNVRRNQIDFYRKFAEKPLYLTKTFSKFNVSAKENMLKLANELEDRYFCKNPVIFLGAKDKINFKINND
jgi:predicted metal-dependent HD superfamily phosphohydrolase